MLLGFIFFLSQAFERYVVSGYAQALSYACVANIEVADAIRINPSALAFLNRNQISSGYEYTWSGVEGLHNVNVGFARPIPLGGLGLVVSEFGFSEQKEQAVTAGLGIGLSHDFKIGLGLDLYLINNKRTGYGAAWGVDLGMVGRLMKRWSLGIYCHNLNKPRLGSNEIGELSPSLQTGFGYRPFNDLSSEIDFSITEDGIRTHIGGECKIFNFFSLRTGIRTEPQVLNLGAGIFYKFIVVDYAVEYLPELPLSHTLTVGYSF